MRFGRGAVQAQPAAELYASGGRRQMRHDSSDTKE